MRHPKIIGLASLLCVALMSFAATAAANPLKSPEGTPYTATIKAEAEGSIELTSSSFKPAKCEKSTVEGKIESHNAATASGKASLSFGECNEGITVKKSGSLTLVASGNGNGTLISNGAEVVVHTSVGECIFNTNNTHIGTLTGSNSTNATVEISSASIPVVGGSFHCPSSAKLGGSYKVTTPNTLYVDTDSPLTSPEGTSYTSTIKAEAETPTRLTSNFFTTVDCKKATVEGKVESHTTTTASGNAVLAFGECTDLVTVLKSGSLEIHATSGGNGTLTSSGAEINVHTSVGECIFTTKSTHIGTLTGSYSVNATLDISAASMPVTGGSFFCPSAAVLEGSYKVTTPSTLLVGHPTRSPLTSPEGTSYTSTIKAEAEASVRLTSSEFVPVACKKATIEGKVESHAATTAGGNVSLAFGECTDLVTVKKSGSLEIHSTSGGNGTLTSTGAELIVHTTVGECVFTTKNTHIGTLTGSNSANATLDIPSASIPVTGGSFFCPSSAVLEGSYKVTTPSTLYVD